MPPCGLRIAHGGRHDETIHRGTRQRRRIQPVGSPEVGGAAPRHVRHEIASPGQGTVIRAKQVRTQSGPDDLSIPSTRRTRPATPASLPCRRSAVLGHQDLNWMPRQAIGRSSPHPAACRPSEVPAAQADPSRAPRVGRPVDRHPVHSCPVEMPEIARSWRDDALCCPRGPSRRPRSSWMRQV